jgi:nicotinamide-nucleotide adenylyltransferase
MTPIGMIHGRFQPFHNGHLDYLKAALSRCDRLIVGITNPEPATIIETAFDDHRHQTDANPYSFYLRTRMIQESITTSPDCADRFSDITIVPFPIHTPSVWAHYVPGSDVIQFMRLLDPWDDEKRRSFSAYGFSIQILDGGRLTSGIEVRAQLRRGGLDWQQNVPDGTRRILTACLEGRYIAASTGGD